MVVIKVEYYRNNRPDNYKSHRIKYIGLDGPEEKPSLTKFECAHDFKTIYDAEKYYKENYDNLTKQLPMLKYSLTIIDILAIDIEEINLKFDDKAYDEYIEHSSK